MFLLLSAQKKLRAAAIGMTMLDMVKSSWRECLHSLLRTLLMHNCLAIVFLLAKSRCCDHSQFYTCPLKTWHSLKVAFVFILPVKHRRRGKVLVNMCSVACVAVYINTLSTEICTKTCVWRCKEDESVYFDIPTAVAVMIWLFGPGRNIFIHCEYLNLFLLRLYWWEFKSKCGDVQKAWCEQWMQRNPNSKLLSSTTLLYRENECCFMQKKLGADSANAQEQTWGRGQNWSRPIEAFCCNWRKPWDQKLVRSGSFHLSFHILNIHCSGWYLFCQL